MRQRRDSVHSREAAEEIAVAVLGFLAETPDHLERFLAESGIGPDTLREAAAAPGFLAGVLAFIEADEARLLAAAEAVGRTPEALVRARAVLSRGEGPVLADGI